MTLETQLKTLGTLKENLQQMSLMSDEEAEQESPTSTTKGNAFPSVQDDAPFPEAPTTPQKPPPPKLLETRLESEDLDPSSEEGISSEDIFFKTPSRKEDLKVTTKWPKITLKTSSKRPPCPSSRRPRPPTLFDSTSASEENNKSHTIKLGPYLSSEVKRPSKKLTGSSSLTFPFAAGSAGTAGI